MLVLPLPCLMPLLALMLPALASTLLPPLLSRESMFLPSLGRALPVVVVPVLVMVPVLVDAEVGRRPPLTVPLPPVVFTLVDWPVIFELLLVLPDDTVVPVFLVERVPTLVVPLLVVPDEVPGTVTLLLEGQCAAPLLRVTLPVEVEEPEPVVEGRRPPVVVLVVDVSLRLLPVVLL